MNGFGTWLGRAEGATADDTGVLNARPVIVAFEKRAAEQLGVGR